MRLVCFTTLGYIRPGAFLSSPLAFGFPGCSFELLWEAPPPKVFTKGFLCRSFTVGSSPGIGRRPQPPLDLPDLPFTRHLLILPGEFLAYYSAPILVTTLSGCVSSRTSFSGFLDFCSLGVRSSSLVFAQGTPSALPWPCARIVIQGPLFYYPNHSFRVFC